MTENKNEESTETNETPENGAGPEAEEAVAPETEEVAEAADELASSEDGQSPEEEIAALKDKLLRSLAENENLIRRARKDREDATKYAASNFARDMLGVADNLRRAMEAVPAELRDGDDAVKAFLEGVQLTERELLSTLERHGIQKLSPLGEKFDHDRHEALFEVPTGPDSGAKYLLDPVGRATFVVELSNAASGDVLLQAFADRTAEPGSEGAQSLEAIAALWQALLLETFAYLPAPQAGAR